MKKYKDCTQVINGESYDGRMGHPRSFVRTMLHVLPNLGGGRPLASSPQTSCNTQVRERPLVFEIYRWFSF